jgi:transcriptional regulator GlxA family with amidase domain
MKGMLKNVAAAVLDGFAPFELGVVCEVFGTDRTSEGLPRYDFAVVAGEPGPLRSEAGFSLETSFGLDRLDTADLIVVPASGDLRCRREEWPEPLLVALRRAIDRGSRVLSVCTGAFVLGAAGLLDGRHCTTHWRHADRLARMYPAAKVDPSVLYVDDEPVITSAGTAAGIDACLYLVRKEQGSRVANAIARRMVVPPHRDGGQAQFIERPLTTGNDDRIAQSMTWALEHLAEPITVGTLAQQAHVSERTYLRYFARATGTSPIRWLISQRIQASLALLETTGTPIEKIASAVGFDTAVTYRHHFSQAMRTSPTAYRRAFHTSTP